MFAPLVSLMAMEDDPYEGASASDGRPTPRDTDQEGTCESVSSLAGREAPRRVRSRGPSRKVMPVGWLMSRL